MTLVGIPARSISFAIVAPQRLQVPQVATSTQAWTPASMNCFAISAPILSESPTAVPTPLVEKNQGWMSAKAPSFYISRKMFRGST